MNRSGLGASVGQTSGLPVSRASGLALRRPRGHGAGGPVNRQTGGLPHTGTVALNGPPRQDLMRTERTPAWS